MVGDGGNGYSVDEPGDFFGGVFTGIDVESVAWIEGGFVVVFTNFGALLWAAPDLFAVLNFAGV